MTRETLIASRFPRLLRAWLAQLPAEGWSGGAGDLADDLDRLNRAERLYAFVPHRRIQPEITSRLDLIAAAGWAVEFRRTAAARMIVFTKMAAKQ
jgi:hypothetical protein